MANPLSTGAGRVVTGIVAVTLGVVVYQLAAMNKDFEINLDKAGQFKVAVRSDANFEALVQAALAENASSVEGALANLGYFRVTDPRVVAALEGLDPADPAEAEVVAGVRHMFRDQRGPFTMPDSLVEVDARLIAAFDSLEKELQKSNRTSDLVIELWRQSLEYQGIFRTRMFDAEVWPYPAAEGEAVSGPIAVYACPGSDFLGKEVMLLAPDFTSISGEVVAHPLHRCDEQDQKLVQLFAREKAVLGLDARAWTALFGADVPTDAPQEARFQFLPEGTSLLLQVASQQRATP
jgi:hypothetical protein